jgi:hypothetical protein
MPLSFSHRPKELYCYYSGWPLGDESDTEQSLFLFKLKSPEESMPEIFITISRRTLRREIAKAKEDPHGIKEGPTWVSMKDWRGIVFSANGSWTNEYKLRLLDLSEMTWQ